MDDDVLDRYQPQEKVKEEKGGSEKKQENDKKVQQEDRKKHPEPKKQQEDDNKKEQEHKRQVDRVFTSADKKPNPHIMAKGNVFKTNKGTVFILFALLEMRFLYIM